MYDFSTISVLVLIAGESIATQVEHNSTSCSVKLQTDCGHDELTKSVRGQ